MERLKQVLSSSLADFAGIIVFYGLMYTVGLKAAIAGTIVFLAIDAVRRWKMELGFPKLYILSGILVVGFGGIDLLVKNPFMIKYEAVITNIVLAGVFALGARGKSMIQELVEQREGESFDPDPRTIRFFKLLTWLWAGYFLLKAAIYAWMGEIMSIERAMAIRPFISYGSLIPMVLLMIQGERLYRLCERIGLLPRDDGEPAAALAAPAVASVEQPGRP